MIHDLGAEPALHPRRRQGGEAETAGAVAPPLGIASTGAIATKVNERPACTGFLDKVRHASPSTRVEPRHNMTFSPRRVHHHPFRRHCCPYAMLSAPPVLACPTGCGSLNTPPRGCPVKLWTLHKPTRCPRSPHRRRPGSRHCWKPPRRVRSPSPLPRCCAPCPAAGAGACCGGWTARTRRRASRPSGSTATTLVPTSTSPARS